MRKSRLEWPLSLTSVAATGDWIVSLFGVGPIRLGMTVSEARRVLRDQTAYLAGNTPVLPLDSCAYLESKRIPKSLGFMFARGRIVRIDVSGTGIRTVGGAGVGDTEEKIKRLFPGQVTVEPHHYDPENGHYLNYWPKERPKQDYGMVFETDHGRVTSFRAGTREAIALVEGCS